ncbi:hypothetical protein ACJW31_04G012300 [Castanea mollissima]
MIRGGEKGLATTKTPGVDYRGILACLDGYMNIAMEQIEEYVNGQLKNKLSCMSRWVYEYSNGANRIISQMGS